MAIGKVIAQRLLSQFSGHLVHQYYNLRQQLALAALSRKVKSIDEGLPIGSRTIRRVLVVIAGLIGDAVMSMPAVLELRRHYPEAIITALVTSKTRELLSLLPAVDDFVEFNHSPFPLHPRKIRGAVQLEGEIRRGQFDLALVLSGDFFVPMLCRAGIPVRVGVRENCFRPLLTHSYSIGESVSSGPDERIESVRVLGLQVEKASSYLTKGLLVVPDEVRKRAADKLSAIDIDGRRPLIVFHPFGSSQHQWLPSELACQLIRQIEDELGAQPVVVGGAVEREFLRKNQLWLPMGVPSLVGDLSISELAALIEHASVVVTTDSGPMHLAGVLGTPTVGLFRAIRTEHAGRYTGTLVGVWRRGETTCKSGCSWDRCSTWPCVQLVEINPSEVLSLAERFLSVKLDRPTNRQVEVPQ